MLNKFKKKCGYESDDENIYMFRLTKECDVSARVICLTSHFLCTQQLLSDYALLNKGINDADMNNDRNHYMQLHSEIRYNTSIHEEICPKVNKNVDSSSESLFY